MNNCKLYHGKNKLHLDEMMLMFTLYLTKHTLLNFYSASPQKQQSDGGHVLPL